MPVSRQLSVGRIARHQTVSKVILRPFPLSPLCSSPSPLPQSLVPLGPLSLHAHSAAAKVCLSFRNPSQQISLVFLFDLVIVRGVVVEAMRICPVDVQWFPFPAFS